LSEVLLDLVLKNLDVSITIRLDASLLVVADKVILLDARVVLESCAMDSVLLVA
jgi:hypothetical protein